MNEAAAPAAAAGLARQSLDQVSDVSPAAGFALPPTGDRPLGNEPRKRRRTMRISLPVALALTASITAAAFGAKEEYGTAKEAEAMVARAVAHIKAVGTDKAYTDFTNKAAGFFDRDLYVVVYDLEGRVLAHGQNPKMVGKVIIDLRDADGKAWIQERVELTKAKAKFWHDYKFTDPITKKVLPKSTYCERVESTAVCVGIYKR
jgi:hypothetical protein